MQPDLNICRITFYSTGGMLDTTQTRLNICRIAFYSNYNVIEVFSNEFEYMSYYLLLKLR